MSILENMKVCGFNWKTNCKFIAINTFNALLELAILLTKSGG